jgi:hypothetical protein
MDALDKRPKRQNIDMKFDTYNIKCLYRVGTLMTDIMGVQEVRWEGNGAHQQENTHFCVEGGMTTMNWVQGFFCT